VLWILFIPYIVWYKFQILKPKLWFLGTTFFVFVFFAYKTFLAKSPELISNFMSGNFAVIDPPRFFLNKVAFYNFLQSPIFGNGLGSMPVFLDDPTHTIPNPERIIDNPMFFFGLLNDIGLLGFFALGLFLFCLHLHFKNTLGIWILFSSLFAGYHVNHPDSAFWILLMLTYLNSKRQVSSLRWAKLVTKVFIGILVLYLVNTAVKAKNSEKVPLFRYDVLQKYQLQAFSVNQKSRVGDKEIEYHNFLGSVIWKVRHKGFLLKVHFFLSEFTKKEFLNLKISYLNQNYDMLSSQIVNIQKWQTRPVQLQISRDVEFIQVEELNEQGKVEQLGKHVYSVNQKNFNEKNEVTRIEGDFE
ncbi:MAG: hypothetical protein N3A69_14930, partial [Leptospiraceae bacterium]|nr:hypothetical protein [Leptospiraceae bacterium]